MALAASLGAVVLMAADAANAQLFDSVFGRPSYGYGYGYGYGYNTRSRAVAPAGPYYQKPKRKRVEAAKTEQTAKPPQGPLLIAISLNSQRLTLYSNGAPIAHSPVSTGTASHPTPSGIFSVIGKERFHRSNLYSNAPMPFMQRITWSGVALHQGVLPGYAASHGCIRLPGNFAQYLWGTTRMGARVIITRDEVAPFDIAHANLFAPKPPEEPVPADQVLGVGTVRVAESADPARTSDAPKSTRAAMSAATQEEAREPKLKGSLDAGAPEPAPPQALAKRTKAAGELSDVIDAQVPSRTAIDTSSAGEAADSRDRAGRAGTTELKETPKMSDPVSVFVSRKAGRLYVRQGFEPLFDVPVTIRDPDLPLGTHLYTALDFNEDRSAMRWSAVTLSAQPGAEPERHKSEKKTHKGKEDEHAVHVSASARLAATVALDRVAMPKDAVDRISDLLSPGASLIISDLPLSGETGKYTDFIILTR